MQQAVKPGASPRYLAKSGLNGAAQDAAVINKLVLLLMVQKSQTATGWMCKTLKITGINYQPQLQLVQDFFHQQYLIFKHSKKQIKSNQRMCKAGTSSGSRITLMTASRTLHCRSFPNSLQTQIEYNRMPDGVIAVFHLQVHISSYVFCQTRVWLVTLVSSLILLIDLCYAFFGHHGNSQKTCHQCHRCQSLDGR